MWLDKNKNECCIVKLDTCLLLKIVTITVDCAKKKKDNYLGQFKKIFYQVIKI